MVSMSGNGPCPPSQLCSKEGDVTFLHNHRATSIRDVLECCAVVSVAGDAHVKCGREGRLAHRGTNRLPT